MNLYDFAYANEVIVHEYRYCGFDVKIASILSDKGLQYYGITNTGEDPLFPPYLHDQKFAAENNIEDFIDNYIEKK